MRCRTALAAGLLVVLALVLAGAASARATRVEFDGGTAPERAQVRAALDASSFDWSALGRPIAVHIRRGIASSAAPGEIWLDASLLDSGQFSWGVVQHEFAHQVDYFLLSDDDRTAIESLLGGSAWCVGGESYAHDDLGCERFATAVAWAYWPSPHNVFDPAGSSDESWLRAAGLRALLAERLGLRNPFRSLTVY